MMQTVKLVPPDNWANCPVCKSEIVQAIENGYQLDGAISTDLMFCLNCEGFYIVLPTSYFKGRGGKVKLLEFPKMIDIDLPEKIIRDSKELARQYDISRTLYERVFQEDATV